jgi:hypothetical protein
MSVANFIPELWAKLIQASLDKAMVYGACCNGLYQGEISGQGSQVHIGRVGAITVKPYAKNSTTVEYETLDSSSQTLTIDQCYYWAFQVDDVDAAQVNAPVITKATQNAAYAIADHIDQFVAGFYDDAGITDGLGTDTTPLQINSSNIVTYILKVGRLMDENNVRSEGRWIVIPPFMHEDLVLADIATNTGNTGTLSNGLIGHYLGFSIYKSNNVPFDSCDAFKVMAGTADAISYAAQISKTESIRQITTFADGVRGLYLYGAKVIEPHALACMTVVEAAEAT